LAAPAIAKTRWASKSPIVRVTLPAPVGRFQ
jgi:hypothetical protein